MTYRLSILLMFAALVGGCMVAPAPERSNIAVRQVPFTPDSGTLAVRCGLLIDGVAGLAHIDALVVIRDGRIKSVKADAGRGDASAAMVPVLDLSDYTCLPGLIDMHTHLTDRSEDADLRLVFTRPLEETLQISRENAAATVLAGFTTVRNLGTYVVGTDVLLRDAVNRGEVLGPRMQVSGPYLTIPHGGGDLYVPGYQEPEDNARFHFGVARGAQEFHDRAEMLLATGSDLLKVIASGAVLAHGSVPSAPEMTREELDAVVKVARGAGKKVAAHAHGAESILMAMNAGAATIEHASYLDDAGIALALKLGNVALSMDVYNGDYIDTEGRRQNWPEEFLRKNIETTEIQRQAFTKAVKAGVPIVYGTDAGVFPHGLNARQFPIMVKRGMPPMRAIQSATSVAALFMGLENDIGSIEVGKFGDLIAVRGNPLVDITLLQNVEVVIKGGLVLKLPAPP